MNLTVPRVFRRTVERCPDRTALIFEDKRWTFLDLEDYSNRVAHFFLGLGYKPGDCIALFMENRPEYVGIWLGCAKIGVVPALINSNLTGKPLLHSINAASAIACVYGTEVAESKFKVVRRIMGLKHKLCTGLLVILKLLNRFPLSLHPILSSKVRICHLHDPSTQIPQKYVCDTVFEWW